MASSVQAHGRSSRYLRKRLFVARFHDGVARNGRYRVNFDATGIVRNVQVLQSTGNEVLDRAAINGLQQWKAEPGREGFVVVPLTFQSR